jgi:hypothetical protein
MEVQMNQEWDENDLLPPTAADLESAYGSRFTSAIDVGSKRIRTKIAKVWMETLPQQDGKPPRKKCVIGFMTLPKPVALNATNKDILVKGVSKNPSDWIGAEIGVFTEPTKNPQGQTVMGLRLTVLAKQRTASAPKPATMPVPDVPDWDPPADEFGDPGPNDPSDFGEAAAE